LEDLEMSKQMKYMVVVMAAMVAFAGVAVADTYTGSLSYAPDGLDNDLAVDGGVWLGYNFTLGWVVTNEDPGAPDTHTWKYSYTFAHDGNQGDISHVIIQVSEGEPDGTNRFTLANMAGLAGATLDSLDTHKTGPGQPEMPEDIYGLKFDPIGDTSYMAWSFYSDRAPVWGDFYAKNGQTGGADNIAYNVGFTSPDSDPTEPPADGPLDYHILVPDTTNGLAELGDKVWLDLDEDGIQDVGELGVSGVEVNLYLCDDDSLVDSKVTDLDGLYLFANLDADDYYLEFILPADHAFTVQGAGGDIFFDSDVDPLTGRTACITLLPGTEDLSWDAGLILDDQIDPPPRRRAFGPGADGSERLGPDDSPSSKLSSTDANPSALRVETPGARSVRS
jgi:hypothetical protein